MKTFLTVLSLVASTSVFAWGSTGHRVVGEIATRFLDVKAQVQIHKILKGNSLSRVANWPDEIKSDPANYSYTYNWHYTTWPKDVVDHNEHTENINTGFLLKAISDRLVVLKDPAASDDQKTFALKFLVHLVGDVHMPLHVSDGADQGGNLCKVVFQGKAINLHALWDEAMLEFTNLSFTEITAFLMEGSTADSINAARSGTAVDWALESKNLAATVYPPEAIPGPVTGRSSYCKKDVHPDEMPKLSYEYSYKFMPVIEKRLFQAGVRLAMLLNNVL